MENVVFERLPGESYGDQKKRFQSALDMVVPKMDKYFSGATHRKFPQYDRAHIRVVKNRGAVNWLVLRYWYEEYMPENLLEGVSAG